MSPLTLRKSIARDLPQLLRTLHRVIDRRCIKLSRVFQESSPVRGRNIISPADQEQLVAVILHRKQIAGVHALRSFGKGHARFELAERAMPELKEGGCITNIDADRSLFRHGMSRRFKERPSKRSMFRGVDIRYATALFELRHGALGEFKASVTFPKAP